MDIKIEIKTENPLSDDEVLQNETQFSAMNVTMKTKSDAFLLEDIAIKTEIKSETPPFTDFYSENGVKSETISCSREIGSQKERELLPDNLVMKYNSKHEIVIKEEPLWPETETSSDNIKVGDLIPVKSPRLCMQAIAATDDDGGSQLPSAGKSGKTTSFSNEKDPSSCERQEISPVKEHIHQKEFGKCNEGEIYDPLLIHKSERSHECNICDKSFTQLSALKLHYLLHKGKMPHRCKFCEKDFAFFSDLKRHTLIHEAKRPHKNKKPHKCEFCEKDFSYWSDLKRHTAIHEGKKPHKCKICEKAFTDVSGLKKHTLIHEGKKPHKCKICKKDFTYLSGLKKHNLIHEGIKPHKCEICEKGFSYLSGLKMHTSIHEGKKPHKCNICEKSFINLSYLKKHNLIHEGKRPHKCEICEYSFTHLSSFKRHNLMHRASQVQRL